MSAGGLTCRLQRSEEPRWSRSTRPRRLPAALRDVLPHATLVVDHWHLHQLANLMLTQVRQRVTQQAHGHRGRSNNDSWVPEIRRRDPR